MKFKNPIPTVDVIIEKGDKIVLVERSIEPFRGKLALVGGHVEYGETVENAAVRETREETGLNIELTDILGVYSNPKRDPRGHRIATVFVAKIISGKFKAATDVKEVGLHNPKKLKKKNIAFDHFKMIEDYLRYAANKKRSKDHTTFWSSRAKS